MKRHCTVMFPLLLAAASVMAQTFKHPGVLSSKTDLDFIKKMVAEKKQPWFTAYTKVLVPRASASFNTRGSAVVDRQCGQRGEQRFWEACIVINALAYRWAITGDKKYADAAIRALNAWNVIQRFKTCTFGTQWHLTIAFGMNRMINGAEIIRYYKQPDGSGAGWSEGDIAKFENMLNRIWNQVTDYNLNCRRNNCQAGCRPGMDLNRNNVGNGEAGKVEAALGIGVFMNDIKKYNWGVKEHKYNIKWAFFDNGENIEDSRDCGHPQMDFAHIVMAAEVTYHQRHLGYNGYEQRVVNGKPILYRALEYRASMVTGKSYTLGHSCKKGKKQSCKTNLWPAYEIPFSYYAGRKAMSVPNAKHMLEGEVIHAMNKPRRPYRPEPIHWQTYGNGTLTHFGVPPDGEAVSEIPAGVIDETPDFDFSASHLRFDFGGFAEGWSDGDLFASGGRPFTFSDPMADAGVANAAPDAVYHTVYHRGESTEPISINFPELPDGDYRLRVHVTDAYGDRAIDMSAEGKTVVRDLDPITEAGGAMLPIVKEIAVTVSDGNGLQILLDDDRAEPKDVFLSGIEIVRTEDATGIARRGALPRRVQGPDSPGALLVNLHGRAIHFAGNAYPAAGAAIAAQRSAAAVRAFLR